MYNNFLSEHISIAHSQKTFQMTRGYITSLSRSPRDQYTWLSSLTAFPETHKPKGGPAQNLRRLMLERATYLLIWLTPLPLSLNPFLLVAHTCTRAQTQLAWFAPKGPLFIFIGVWGFTLVKRQGRSPEWYLCIWVLPVFIARPTLVFTGVSKG